MFFLLHLVVVLSSVRVAGNGLRLPEGGDFEKHFTVNQAETLIEAQSLI